MPTAPAPATHSAFLQVPTTCLKRRSCSAVVCAASGSLSSSVTSSTAPDRYRRVTRPATRAVQCAASQSSASISKPREQPDVATTDDHAAHAGIDREDRRLARIGDDSTAAGEDDTAPSSNRGSMNDTTRRKISEGLKGKKRGPMSIKARKKISESLKGRNLGPQTAEHRRNRVRAMRAAWNSKSSAERRKACSVCGEVGHNKRGCPQISGKPKKAPKVQMQCSVCGEVGHNKRTCPQQKRAQLAAKASRKTAVPAAAADTSAIRQQRAAQNAPPPSSLAENGAAAERQSVSAAPRELFRSGLHMEVREGNPFHLGPVPASTIFPLPLTIDDAVKLAWTASYRAWLDGERKQCIQWLLPTANAADPQMPANTAQQFQSALRRTETLLRSLKANDGLRGSLKAELLTSGAEPVGKWEGDRLAAVIFPTAETMPALRSLDTSGASDRLLLSVNPQWIIEGQIISDFGIGVDAQRSKTFIDSFFDVFSHTRVSVYGDRVILLRVYPGNWQVYLCPENSKPRIVGVDFKRPSFARLEELLQGIPGTRCSMSWIDRIRAGAPSSWATLNYASTTAEDAPAEKAANNDPNSIDSLLKIGSETARGSSSSVDATVPNTASKQSLRKLESPPDDVLVDHKAAAPSRAKPVPLRNQESFKATLGDKGRTGTGDREANGAAQADVLRERCLVLDAKIEKLQAERAQMAQQLAQLEAPGGSASKQGSSQPLEKKPPKGYRAAGFEADGAKAARDPKQNMMDVFRSIMLLGSQNRQAD